MIRKPAAVLLVLSLAVLALALVPAAGFAAKGGAAGKPGGGRGRREARRRRQFQHQSRFPRLRREREWLAELPRHGHVRHLDDRYDSAVRQLEVLPERSHGARGLAGLLRRSSESRAETSASAPVCGRAAPPIAQRGSTCPHREASQLASTSFTSTRKRSRVFLGSAQMTASLSRGPSAALLGALASSSGSLSSTSKLDVVLHRER